MEFNWIWQGLLTNWLAELIIVGGGAVLAIARAKGWRWATPALFGLGGSSILLFCVVLIQVWTAIPPRRQTITAAKLESIIRVWCDTFGVSTTKESDPAAYWSLVLRLKSNGRSIIVQHRKDRENYVVMVGTIRIAQEHRDTLEAWADARKASLLRDVSFELAKAGIQYSITLPAVMVVERRIPITSDLSEATFIENVDHLDRAVTVARDAFVLQLERYVKDPSAGGQQLRRSSQ